MRMSVLWGMFVLAFVFAACSGEAVIDSPGGAGGDAASGGTSSQPSPRQTCTELIERICGCCDARVQNYACDVNSSAYDSWIDSCAGAPPANAGQLGDTCDALPQECDTGSELSPCRTAPCDFDASGSCQCV